MPPIDRETLLVGFSGLLVLWIAWVDARPFVQRWWMQRKEPPLKIEFPDEINHIGKYGPNKRSRYYLNKERGAKDSFTRSHYYVGLKNTTGQTIKNVTVHLHALQSGGGWFPEQRFVSQHGDEKVDIKPGYTEYFLIGFRDYVGMNAEHVIISGSTDILRLSNEWKYHGNADRLGFMINVAGDRKIPLLKNDGAGFELGIYAEDMPPSRHLFVINCKTRFEMFYDGALDAHEFPVTETQLGKVKMRREPTRYLFEDSEPQSHQDTATKRPP